MWILLAAFSVKQEPKEIEQKDLETLQHRLGNIEEKAHLKTKPGIQTSACLLKRLAQIKMKQVCASAQWEK